ncbi:MAG: DUF427 domain-containing protein [Pseudomonadota bacterium]
MEDVVTNLPGNPVRNPDHPAHMMWITRPERRFVASLNGETLAESDNAVVVTELGRSMYAAAIYFPAQDVAATLVEQEDTTICPVKGKSRWLTLETSDGEPKPKFAWSYFESVPGAEELTSRIAFSRNEVTITDAPL